MHPEIGLDIDGVVLLAARHAPATARRQPRSRRCARKSRRSSCDHSAKVPAITMLHGAILTIVRAGPDMGAQPGIVRQPVGRGVRATYSANGVCGSRVLVARPQRRVEIGKAARPGIVEHRLPASAARCRGRDKARSTMISSALTAFGGPPGAPIRVGPADHPVPAVERQVRCARRVPSRNANGTLQARAMTRSGCSRSTAASAKSR